jgi:hypothetical protein
MPFPPLKQKGWSVVSVNGLSRKDDVSFSRHRQTRRFTKCEEARREIPTAT